ncbi:hypothetical protein QYE76_010801 [Lolium multiflorum]|uniref:Retrotransposon gag domain-containing protein n=1 Tax=Lolium multiflorum TaxID=4521 RepID=A0AAD8TXW8_LOLMU|nr:hypothetical protein QYE76_010801 [Lolium multiflorum]
MRTSLPHYYLRHYKLKMIRGKLKSNEVRIGPMTRARAKLLKQQVNLFLNDTLINENFILPKSYYLCMIRYEEEPSIARGVEERLDEKMDVKLDMELDMKTSMDARGGAGGMRERKMLSGGADPARPAVPPDHPVPGRSDRICVRPVQTGVALVPTGRYPGPGSLASPGANDAELVNQKDKDAADLITWRDYEALCNEMRREFRIEGDGLRGEVQEINQKLDATNETVTAMADQMTDIQRTLQALQLAVENLTNQQQQQDEDPDEVPGCGNRPRGWAPLGRHGRGQDKEDGLGKPKVSISKFEGGADVEEYLTWELKIEKLWSLHTNYTEDRKIKLASSEFDGYALRWWDALVRNRQADGEQPIITWRAMNEATNSRFVPTNYLRTIFNKLTLLRQGVKTVDEYYMDMEMLMQRGRVHESLEMTMQRFLNGLKYDVKGIVRHYSYTNMNQLLHHAREAESHLVDEAKVKGRATGAGRFTPRAPHCGAGAINTLAPYSTPPSKPVSNVSNTKKSESLQVQWF